MTLEDYQKSKPRERYSIPGYEVEIWKAADWAGGEWIVDIKTPLRDGVLRVTVKP